MPGVALGTCLPPRLSKVLGSGAGSILGEDQHLCLQSLRRMLRQGKCDQKAAKQEPSWEAASGILVGIWDSGSEEPAIKSQLQTVSFPLTTANPTWMKLINTFLSYQSISQKGKSQFAFKSCSFHRNSLKKPLAVRNCFHPLDPWASHCSSISQRTALLVDCACFPCNEYQV